jgi:hypothetical protein
MQSFRDTFKNAVDRKRMPTFKQGSMRDLGLKLGLSVHISVLNIIRALDNLPAATVTYSATDVSTGNVQGWAQVGFQSDGVASFRGHVHESGDWGDNYIVAVVFPDVKDGSGKSLAFARSGNVAGNLDFGSKDDDWQDDVSGQVISDQWDLIKNSIANGPVVLRIQTSTNPFYVTETVVLALLGGIIVGGILFLAGTAQWKCYWRTYDPNDPESTGLPGCEGS